MLARPGGQQQPAQAPPLPAMSFGYGPTVVLAPALAMSEPFGAGFEPHKENYCSAAPGASKGGSANSHTAFANISNGCYAELPAEGFLVYDDACCAARAQQQAPVASTSNRPPLGELGQPRASAGTGQRRAPGLPAPAKRQAWVDIDEQNRDNPLACSEYAESIFAHLNTSELLNRPNPRYLEAVQADMSPHMRCILVDWLVEVAQEYRLTSDTLHLTLNLLDRFLSVAAVPREELQLAGIAAMWAAAKFEEIYAPTARNFCYITDNTYDQAELVAMEGRLLAALGWRLSVPTAKTFQRRYLQAAGADEQLHYLSAFLLELSLMDEALLAFLPSQLAAGSVFAANAMLGRRPWDATLAHYSRYAAADAAPVAAALAAAHARLLGEGQFNAIRDKYASDKLLNVAAVPPCPKLLAAAAAAAACSPGAGSPGSGGSADGSSDMELL
ncbi:CYCA2-1 [Scenedesmus sp. PABB004]|nr:CYCA2-1 [Scenedesmus sp. PABB004]